MLSHMVHIVTTGLKRFIRCSNNAAEFIGCDSSHHPQQFSFSNTECPFYCFPEHDSCHGASWRVQALYAIVKLPACGNNRRGVLYVWMLISWFVFYCFEIRAYGLPHAVHWRTCSPGVPGIFVNGLQPLLWAGSRAARVSGMPDCLNCVICIVDIYNW